MSQTVTQSSTSGASALEVDGHRIASRVVFPAGGDLDVLPIYVDRPLKDSSGALRPDDIIGRRSVRVRPGQRISLGSYFNAFPAGYWRRWTVVDHVRLSVTTSGPGMVIVYKSNARGNRQRVDSFLVSGPDHVISIDLALQTFGDGGWYWFDLVAGNEAFHLDEATWWVPSMGRRHGSVTLATTTYNKPDYVIENLRAEAADPDLLGVVDQLLIVDQGTQKVVDAEGYAEVAALLGDTLDILVQPNLGGSGGFARGQYEAVTRGLSDYVMLLDDDLSIEPESVIRLVTFADMCKSPTLVGGHMFDIMNRSVLHTFGEIVHPYYWQPGLPGPDHVLGHDFNTKGLRSTTWMHQRVDVDYNGWWMCLIPTRVIREIGLPLPVFIKWDDAEYGVRAKKAGFHTVSLPGAAVWHISWVDKDDLVGWQAYFHERNRLITALLHSPFPKGGYTIRNSEMNDLKHLVAMQYYTMTGRLMGQDDLFAGPDQLHEILASRNAEIRGMAKEFTDAVLKPDYEDFPPLRMRKPRKPPKQRPVPEEGKEVTRTASDAWLAGGKAVLRQFLPPREGAEENPQTQIAHKDNKWFNVAQWDSALVTNAEGTGLSWYKRQPRLMRQMMARSIHNHTRLFAEWEKLREQYRSALPQITSFEAWRRTFGIEPDSGAAD